MGVVTHEPQYFRLPTQHPSTRPCGQCLDSIIEQLALDDLVQLKEGIFEHAIHVCLVDPAVQRQRQELRQVALSGGGNA